MPGDFLPVTDSILDLPRDDGQRGPDNGGVIVAHDDIKLTHRMCPDCAEKMDPDNKP